METMHIEVVLLFVVNVLASKPIMLKAIRFDGDQVYSFDTVYLGDEIGDDLFRFTVSATVILKLQFTSGQGRVYGTDNAYSKEVVLKKIKGSPLLGIVQISNGPNIYIVCIFLLEGEEDDPEEIASKSGRSYEEIMTALLRSENENIPATSELLFYYEFLLPKESRPNVVRVQVENTGLAIRNLDINAVKQNENSRFEDLAAIKRSSNLKFPVWIIKGDLSSRFVAYELELSPPSRAPAKAIFSFVFENKEDGLKWLSALSAALRVWRVTGIPQSIGTVQIDEQSELINRILTNTRAFQDHKQKEVLVLVGRDAFSIPDNSVSDGNILQTE